MAAKRQPRSNGRRAKDTLLADLSDAMQDYLREIYKLESESGRVKTSKLAERMGVAAPSATAMVKKLAGLGLAEHELYRGVRLTQTGERTALEVLRHHRLLELYLAETFDLGLDAVHAEADRLEHALSETLERRIDEALGSPRRDPHGDPIPDARLRIAELKAQPLSQLGPGDEATVLRIPDRDGELLRYLATLSLVPGERVVFVAAEPLRGPVIVRTAGRQRAISRELADQIRVSI